MGRSVPALARNLAQVTGEPVCLCDLGGLANVTLDPVALERSRVVLMHEAGNLGAEDLPARLGNLVERYYWVTAAISATLMVATGLASAHFWKRRIASDPSATRVRFTHSTLGVITALTACLLLVETAGSALAALEPATSLLGVIGAG
jgi:hypothetical protein